MHRPTPCTTLPRGARRTSRVRAVCVGRYGGSANEKNVDDLMACADIDGCLVGGASLKPDSFGRIINFVKK